MIEIDVSAFILTIIVFIALVGYLNRRLYQPLLAFMDAEMRLSSEMRTRLIKAAEVDSEAKEIEDILTKARNEAATVRQDGLSQIEADEAEGD